MINHRDGKWSFQKYTSHKILAKFTSLTPFKVLEGTILKSLNFFHKPVHSHIYKLSLPHSPFSNHALGAWEQEEIWHFRPITFFVMISEDI